VNRRMRSDSLVLQSLLFLAVIYAVVFTLVASERAALDAARLRAIEHRIVEGPPFEVHNDCGGDQECREKHPGVCPADQPYCF
jgi:hypothetical protein